MEYLFLDFETRSKVDLRVTGADAYARDPSTQVMATGYAFGDEKIVLGEMDEFPHLKLMNHVAQGGKVVSHNAPFEWVIWNYCWMRQFPNLPKLNINQMLCTMSMAYAMGLPGSLENAAHAAGIHAQKDMKGSRVMMQLCKPNKSNGEFIEPYENPGKFKEMYAYCVQDIKVERELFYRLMHLSKSEYEIWLLDHEINQRGVQIDLPLVQKAIDFIEAEKQRLDFKMREVTEGAVSMCTAVGQLTDWIKSKGIKVEGVAKNDIIDLLETEVTIEVRQALQLRQEAAKSSTAKLKTMLGSVSDDGRLRSIFQYHGAGTGRWAGRKVQPQNFPRPKISHEEIEQVFSILGGIDGRSCKSPKALHTTSIGY